MISATSPVYPKILQPHQVEGRDVMLVDDMTETAGTLCAAAELLKENGHAYEYDGGKKKVFGG